MITPKTQPNRNLTISVRDAFSAADEALARIEYIQGTIVTLTDASGIANHWAEMLVGFDAHLDVVKSMIEVLASQHSAKTENNAQNKEN